MFFLALSPTNLLACDTNALFSLLKITATQASWSVWALFCWIGQGANWSENHVDLLCV